MCGRYILGQVDDLSERFQLRGLDLDVQPTWNAAPTQRLPVIVVGEDGANEARLMRWGLLPRWKPRGPGKAPEPFNARAETLAERAMFKPLLARRRCLVPATGFYEWRSEADGKQPVVLRPTDQEIFAFAGLWDQITGEDGEPVQSFTIITTAPNSLIEPIHHRMAAILDRDDEEAWIDPGLTEWPAAESLIRSYPASRMEMFPVSKAVNNARSNGPELAEPIEVEAGAH